MGRFRAARLTGLRLVRRISMAGSRRWERSKGRTHEGLGGTLWQRREALLLM